MKATRGIVVFDARDCATRYTTAARQPWAVAEIRSGIELLGLQDSIGWCHIDVQLTDGTKKDRNDMPHSFVLSIAEMEVGARLDST